MISLCGATLLSIPMFMCFQTARCLDTSATLNRNAEAKSSSYLQWARLAADHLNKKWYNQDTGQWNHQWWQSGNAMTMTADLAAVDRTYKPQAERIFSNSLAKAGNGGGSKIFIGEFYDDMGWWAVAWIRVYDVTHNAAYLRAAETIFENMLTGLNTPCGGIWWSKKRANLATISNTLYLSTAVKLANRAAPDKKAFYKKYAMTQWTWFNQSTLIHSNFLVCDGLNKSTCQVLGHCVTLTYTAGVLIGALIELDRLDAHKQYLDLAVKIGNAVTTKLVKNGILAEGSQNSNSNFAQFKGAFVRNLMLLHQVKPQKSFVEFFKKNADSIWSKDRNSTDSQLGPDWQGPFIDESTTKKNGADMGSQNSAISCLLGAHVAVEK